MSKNRCPFVLSVELPLPVKVGGSFSRLVTKSNRHYQELDAWLVILLQKVHNRDEDLKECLDESELQASLRKITDCFLINIFTPAF